MTHLKTYLNVYFQTANKNITCWRLTWWFGRWKLFAKKIPTDPGIYPRYPKILIWKDFLHKQVVESPGSRYVPGVGWSFLRNWQSGKTVSAGHWHPRHSCVFECFGNWLHFVEPLQLWKDDVMFFVWFLDSYERCVFAKIIVCCVFGLNVACPSPSWWLRNWFHPSLAWAIPAIWWRIISRFSAKLSCVFQNRLEERNDKNWMHKKNRQCKMISLTWYQLFFVTWYLLILTYFGLRYVSIVCPNVLLYSRMSWEMKDSYQVVQELLPSMNLHHRQEIRRCICTYDLDWLDWWVNKWQDIFYPYVDMVMSESPLQLLFTQPGTIFGFYSATSPIRSCTEELSSSGQLCVRTKGGLVPMLDFLKQHGYIKPLGLKHVPALTADSWFKHLPCRFRSFIPGKRRPNRCHPKLQLHRSFVRYKRHPKAMCDIIRRRITRRRKRTTLGADMCGG